MPFAPKLQTDQLQTDHNSSLIRAALRVINGISGVFRAIHRIRNNIGDQARIILNIAALIYSILRVEFTIVVNKIQGVNNLNTTGQLIPFVVSLGAMLAMIGEVMTRERRELYGFPLRAGKSSPGSSDGNV